jgi:hypothetical protein
MAQALRQHKRKPGNQQVLLSLAEGLNRLQQALDSNAPLSARLRAFSQCTAAFAPQMATLDKETRIRLEGLMDAFDASTAAELEKIEDADLIAALNNHWKLRLQPSLEWTQAWYRTSQKRMASFDTKAFATALYSLSMLRMQPPEAWMKRWLSHTQPMLATCEQPFCNIAYALAGQLLEGTMIPAAYRQALGKELAHRSTNQPGPIGQYHAAVTLLELPQPDWLRDAKPILSETYRPTRRQSSLESEFREHIRPYLEQCKDCVEPRWEKWSSFTYSPLDLALYHKPGKAGGRQANLYVQLDGVGHFVKDAVGVLMLDGKSSIQSAVLKKHLGPHERLMRVSGRDFAGNPERTVQEVMATLTELAQHAPQSAQVSDVAYQGTPRTAVRRRG